MPFFKSSYLFKQVEQNYHVVDLVNQNMLAGGDQKVSIFHSGLCSMEPFRDLNDPNPVSLLQGPKNLAMFMSMGG